jgi:hypothetical protein
LYKIVIDVLGRITIIDARDSNAVIMNQLILKLHQIDKGMKQDGVNEKFLEFPDIDPQTAEKVLEEID